VLSGFVSWQEARSHPSHSACVVCDSEVIQLGIVRISPGKLPSSDWLVTAGAFVGANPTDISARIAQMLCKVLSRKSCASSAKDYS